MFDSSTASGQELCERRLALEDEQRARDAEAARIDAELDRRATTDVGFGLSTGSWLAARRDLPVGLCRYRVRVANKLASRLDITLSALEAGRISWDHVKVINEAANPRIIDKIAAVQPLLIDEAQGQTFNRWKAMVMELAQRQDVEGGYDPVRDRPGTAYCSPIIDGMVNLFASLTPAQALTVMTELERVTDELYRQAVRDHRECPEVPIPDRAELRAQALTEIHRRCAARDLRDTAPPRPEFIVLLHPDQPASGATADPPEHDDSAAAPTTRAPGWPSSFSGRAETPDGVPVRPDLLHDLCPDAVWRAMWLDPTGVPLRMGRTRRTATPAQRAALAVRDGGCVFPGCDRPIAWCDAHHVDEWDHDRGDTDLPVLALLCRHHHGVTHRTGWTMAAHPDQTFTWTTPAGATLHSQRHHRQRRTQPSGARAA